jgi:hypothetical protein
MIFSQDTAEICSSIKSLEDRVAAAERHVVASYHGYPEEVSLKTTPLPREGNFPIEDDMPGRVDSTIKWNSNVMCMMFTSDESVLPCTIYTKHNTDDMDWNGFSPARIIKKNIGGDLG